MKTTLKNHNLKRHMNRLIQIELVESSICKACDVKTLKTISKEATNIVESFKTVLKDELVGLLSDINDTVNYKYTHEAILHRITTHGLFQFSLVVDKSKNKFENYEIYLEDRILEIFTDLRPHEVITVAIELFLLLACHLAIKTRIDSRFKLLQVDALRKIVECYEYYNGADSLSIALSKIKEEIKI